MSTHHTHHSTGTSGAADAAPGGDEVEYTCPMHPEIRQLGPGSCPICGMALEPVVVTADTGPSAELRDMTRRFWIGAVLTVPVVLLEMGRHLIEPLYDAIPSDVATWAQLLLATIPIAAGVLYPVTGMLLSPIIAAAAMALCSVSVITNALRLRTQHLG